MAIEERRSSKRNANKERIQGENVLRNFTFPLGFGFSPPPLKMLSSLSPSNLSQSLSVERHKTVHCCWLHEVIDSGVKVLPWLTQKKGKKLQPLFVGRVLQIIQREREKK